MTMTCRTCQHPEREAIDLALAGGESERGIAKRYGLNLSGVHRHKAHHLRPSLATKLATLSEADRSIVPYLLSMRDKAIEIMESADDGDAKLRAIDRVLHSLDRLGHASGELLPAQVQQVYVSLGVRDEGELRRILDEHNRLRAASGEEALRSAEADAIEALRLVIAEQPERLDGIVAALRDTSVAIVEEE